MDEKVNDVSSGIFNMFLGIGQILGALFGTYITQYFGFRICCDSVALMCLIFAILYFIFADGCKAFRDSKWVNKNRIN